MEHSDYIKLTSLLESIIAGNNLLHWANHEGRQYIVEHPKPGMLLFPDVAERFIIPWADPLRYFDLDTSTVRWDDVDGLERMIIDRLKLACGLMYNHQNGFYNDNQERADNHLPATQDFVSLYNAICRLLSCHEVNDRWDERVREMAKEWATMATTWFPDLNHLNDQAGNPGTDGDKTGKGATVTVDLERLKGCFNKDFTDIKPGQQNSRCEMLYYAMTTARFTKTNWGRVAYAIKWNHKIVADHVRFMDFTTWLKEFFKIIGLEPPKDTRQNKYQDPAGAGNFITQWLR